MFALFSNLDSISPCQQVHSFAVIHRPNLDSSGCTEHLKTLGDTQEEVVCNLDLHTGAELIGTQWGAFTYCLQTLR